VCLAIGVDGWWAGGLLELESLCDEDDGEFDVVEGAALIKTIAAGDLPSLQRLVMRGTPILTELNEVLRRGTSPRLTHLEVRGERGDAVAFAEVLEARMALGCCALTDLALHVDWPRGDPVGSPKDFGRLCSSPALAKIRTLRFINSGPSDVDVRRTCLRASYGDRDVEIHNSHVSGFQVVAVSEALGQLKPQELTEFFYGHT
jgi:hypothetical protein